MGHRIWALLILTCLLLTGCWDRQEINDIAIVNLAGLDKVEKGLRLSVQVVIPSRMQPGGQGGSGGGGGGKSPVTTYSAEGETVMDAMMEIQQKLSRRLFWGHTRTLIFGEAFAREGIRTALDFWSRSREPRPRLQIAITPGEALQFMSIHPEMELVPVEGVRELINSRLQLSTTVKEFMGGLSKTGQHPVAPRVELVSAAPNGPKQEVRITGTAVFRKDRLIGWLDEGATRGLLWLRGEVQQGVVTVSLPTGGKASMQLIRARTSVRPEYVNGRLSMLIQIETEDDLLESSQPIDLSKTEVVQSMKGLLERELQMRIQESLQLIQQDHGVDVVRFAESVNRYAPFLWKQIESDWEERFPELPVRLEVTAHVRRTGKHSAPMADEDPKVKQKTKEFLKQKE